MRTIEEAVAELRKDIHSDVYLGKKTIRTYLDEILEIHNAEKTGRWIPVSERLPSDDEYVIVSVLDDHGDTPWKYTAVAWICNGVWISNNDILCGTAVAWMPLPQPYTTGSEEV